ncbi:hypothetical protein KM043_010923 [Ampulex compressa]|nr:hypothetical protein KM043_010923 [Ampulex compressa]
MQKFLREALIYRTKQILIVRLAMVACRGITVERIKPSGVIVGVMSKGASPVSHGEWLAQRERLLVFFPEAREKPRVTAISHELYQVVPRKSPLFHGAAHQKSGGRSGQRGVATL